MMKHVFWAPVLVMIYAWAAAAVAAAAGYAQDCTPPSKYLLEMHKPRK
jgi:hypothetical protein